VTRANEEDTVKVCLNCGTKVHSDVGRCTECGGERFERPDLLPQGFEFPRAGLEPAVEVEVPSRWTGNETPVTRYLILPPDDHVKRKVLCDDVPVLRALRVDDVAGNTHYLIDTGEALAWHFDGPGILSGEPTDARPRIFPCARFAIEAPRASEGEELRIRCLGPPVEPLLAARLATADDFETGPMPWNGLIVADRGFDEYCDLFGVSGQSSD
jgi:hypothetical protein